MYFKHIFSNTCQWAHNANDNVLITSKRRRDVIGTLSLWHMSVGLYQGCLVRTVIEQTGHIKCIIVRGNSLRWIVIYIMIQVYFWLKNRIVSFRTWVRGWQREIWLDDRTAVSQSDAMLQNIQSSICSDFNREYRASDANTRQSIITSGDLSTPNHHVVLFHNSFLSGKFYPYGDGHDI